MNNFGMTGQLGDRDFAFRKTNQRHRATWRHGGRWLVAREVAALPAHDARSLSYLPWNAERSGQGSVLDVRYAAIQSWLPRVSGDVTIVFDVPQGIHASYSRTFFDSFMIWLHGLAGRPVATAS